MSNRNRKSGILITTAYNQNTHNQDCSRQHYCAPAFIWINSYSSRWWKLFTRLFQYWLYCEWVNYRIGFLWFSKQIHHHDDNYRLHRQNFCECYGHQIRLSWTPEWTETCMPLDKFQIKSNCAVAPCLFKDKIHEGQKGTQFRHIQTPISTRWRNNFCIRFGTNVLIKFLDFWPRSSWRGAEEVKPQLGTRAAIRLPLSGSPRHSHTGYLHRVNIFYPNRSDELNLLSDSIWSELSDFFYSSWRFGSSGTALISLPMQNIKSEPFSTFYFDRYGLNPSDLQPHMLRRNYIVCHEDPGQFSARVWG